MDPDKFTAILAKQVPKKVWCMFGGMLAIDLHCPQGVPAPAFEESNGMS